ncbi:hypothetical protein FJV41_19815 [Myxococcus llanfairpwllgwyngyllgogerychwyrndrobwllllantysiliogogogochensis]|uniref:Uncharacterized protein n=1 Tax=Myxococcus llanfairpwllgwyngyllgogerychwyrndrobwllllantysiliogogogochensis TaxID=2590453 RepID=A0A540WYY8_9BACT|nr:hypothetical protein [Myxococcus llanfairpwllgwyngyllgogerychwyrndrobwllllantysiliogogogochensis]TQF14218.1 hypothetical protein FJV41_19815 [Myxococcus llanfairpwllgwyngyllgogerychwyrndrobwllllantysiliogogogochensis]
MFPGLLHVVAWAVVMTGTLVCLGLCLWLSVVALRAVLKWSGWWSDFFAFMLKRRRTRRAMRDGRTR